MFLPLKRTVVTTTDPNPWSPSVYPPRKRIQLAVLVCLICILLVSVVGFHFGSFYVSTSTVTPKAKGAHVLTEQQGQHQKPGSHQGPTDGENLITLVTGFWAQAQNAPNVQPHRRELEASLVANLQNPHFHQVLVILDSVSKNTTEGCPEFVAHINSLMGPQDSEHSAVFTCRERTEGQPTYYEMFQYCLDTEWVKGSVVVMSNADQAFDDTMVFAKALPSDFFWTLSTQGFLTNSNNSTRSLLPPSRLLETYDRIVVGREDHKKSQGNAKKKKTPTSATNRCVPWRETDAHPKYSLSWDAYIFRPETIRRSLNATYFMRPNFYRQPSWFYMNENGAENAALYAVSQGLMNSTTFWNACYLIQSWHFHLTPKMHHKEGNMKGRWPRVQGGKGFLFHDGTDSPDNIASDFVPHPRALIPLCEGQEECFSSNRGTGTFRYSNTGH
jgi:hypothetical protein